MSAVGIVAVLLVNGSWHNIAESSVGGGRAMSESPTPNPAASFSPRVTSKGGSVELGMRNVYDFADY